MYKLIADGLVLLHVAFVVFVLLGGLAVAWRPRMAWLHLPAVLWGVLVETFGWTCPLTPWEQGLRRAAGEAAYGGSFVDHYVLPVLYPAGLTRDIQLGLAVVVILVNAVLYAWVLVRARTRRL